MMNIFRDATTKVWDDKKIIDKLKSIGASDCDMLFIHSDISFGLPIKGMKRNEYLNALYQCLLQLGVPTLVFPTFTYSFCNNEVYDVLNSKTSMGALNEFARQQKDAVRSVDPLLSMVAIGENNHVFEGNLGHHSLGIDGGFGRIHRTNNVKFLFFGADFGKCFTYVHFVEKVLDVPYRFDMKFSGKIIDKNRNSIDDIHYIHTACGGVLPADFPYFEDELKAKGYLKVAKLGNLNAACVSEKDAYREIAVHIKDDINYFLQKPFSKEDLSYEYTKGKNGERITHC